MKLIECRASNVNRCRVHGTGGLHEELVRQQNEHLKNKNMDGYLEAKEKMEALNDNSQEAIDWYNAKVEREKPLTERIGDTVYDALDRIDEVRENVNNALIAGADRIADRHAAPLPENGTVIEWTAMNLFKRDRAAK